MVPWYERLGFINKGPSECTIAGGGWHDMVSKISFEREHTANLISRSSS